MYIYTVKPLREAIKIAVEHDRLEVDDSGEVRIYGIFLKNWPAEVQIKSKERITDRSIQNVGEFGFSIPLQCFTETEEKTVPEFIKGLYDAMTENCGNVNCEDCPLHLVNKHTDLTCSEMISWTKKRWFSNDTRRI